MASIVKAKNFVFAIRDKAGKINKLKKILEISLIVFLLLVFTLSISLEDVVPFNYISILAFAFFCLLLFVYIFLMGKLFVDKYLFMLIIFLITQYVSLVFNLFPYFTQTPTLMCFMSIFVYLFLRQSVDLPKKVLRLLFVPAIFLVLIFSIVYFRNILHPSFSDRIGTFFGNQNDVARHLSFACIIFTYFAFSSKKLALKIMWYILTVYTMYCILLTGSVSNTGSIIIIFFVHLYFYFKKSTKMKIIYIVSLLLLVALFIVVINLPFFSYYKHRILSMLNSFFGNNGSLNNRDTSAEGRFRAAIYGFQLFMRSPVFGNGYRSVFRNYYIMSHNNISEMASDFGILGLIIGECMILYPLIKNKEKNVFILLMVLYIFILQFFLVTYNSKIESIIIPVCFSLLNKKEIKLLTYSISFKEVNI